MAAADLPEPFEEVEAVLVILEYRLSAVATGHYVVGSAGILEAERAGHAPCYRGTAVQPSRNSDFKD
jgi:hypothetical protein